MKFLMESINLLFDITYMTNLHICLIEEAKCILTPTTRAFMIFLQPYLTFIPESNSYRCKVLLKGLTTCAESEDKEQESCLYDGNDRRQNCVDTNNTDLVNPFASVLNQSDDPISQFMQTLSRSENSSAADPTEMYLPGLLIHIVPQSQNLNIPLWKSWRIHDDHQKYKAFFANRDDLKDIIVSPNMFLDHLPWRYTTFDPFSPCCNIDLLIQTI